MRMPFCNLSCVWCDTSFNTFTKWSEEEFRQFALKEKTRFAVVTGGEPMMHKHTPRVVAILKEVGYEIACETNGTFPIVDGIDFVTCSPKRDADFEFHADVAQKVNELKYVVDKDFDFQILRDLQNQAWTKNVRLTLSPEHGDMADNMQKILEFIEDNPRWRYSLQTHKILGVK